MLCCVALHLVDEDLPVQFLRQQPVTRVVSKLSRTRDEEVLGMVLSQGLSQLRELFRLATE